MKTTFPEAVYTAEISSLNIQRKKVQQQKEWISWGRLAAILAAIAALYFLWSSSTPLAISIALVCTAIFLRLVVIAVNVSAKLQNLNRLIAINEQELKTEAGRYFDLFNGAEFQPAVHAYANDLDIFGRASVYQFINRAMSGQGRKTLAEWLLQPAGTEEILQRQQAVKVLQAQYQWRQELQAHSAAEPVTIGTQQKINDWLQQEQSFFTHGAWQLVRIIGPAIIIAITAFYIADKLETKWFNLALLVFFLFTGYISKKATVAYNTLTKIAPEIATLSKTIYHIENQTFTSGWLQRNQAHFTDGQKTASVSVKTLNGILGRLDIRLNPVLFLPINILLFWDLQQMLAFEKWKKTNKEHIMNWFNAAGEMEALSSLSTLAFNHPTWAFPEMAENHGTYLATELGHPLIPFQKRVNSTFTMEETGQIAVITGSNMAGKSTFLRSIGLSLVMGMAGAPVCAVSARFSRMPVMSSMRISDNLEESTSTFYAELKKLKSIIEAVKRKEKVFLLLDEILRGTNSLDRHTGSKALIQQLIKEDASGIIATHDLELAELITTYPVNIHNYHFDVQVANEELFFDYALKDGICQSLNASILMKKIGIEM